jgi:amino acid transporter
VPGSLVGGPVVDPRRAPLRSWRLTGPGILFIAFAFTVMADPVSSIAYAIESALRHLDGDLDNLFLALALVLATIAVIAATYHQLIRRFPEGGGGARSVGTAYGEAWAFIPLGALLVDFVITVAISCAAGASAIIAYVPGLEPERVVLGLLLTALVAAGISLGHRGRVAFASATLLFLVLATAVIVAGAFGTAQAPVNEQTHAPVLADASLIPALLAMPLAMALATGIEAPSDAIAQLTGLDRSARRRFGQWTIWLTVGIVAVLTMGISTIAIVNGVGLPPADSTLLAEVARTSVGDGAVFAAFQAASALLLLAAAASSYLAASGLLKALALVGANRDDGGLVPARFAMLNRFHVPPWGILVVLVASAALIAMAGGRDQEIVRYYAVSVFAGFLGATIGCARLSHRDGKRGELAVNLLGVALVAFVLSLNAVRPAGIVVLSAAGLLAGYLYAVWVRRGRPSGVAQAEVLAEADVEDAEVVAVTASEDRAPR